MIGPGSQVDDRYELRERLGVGGSGEVWRATDAMLHRDVALKVVGSDVEPDRLRREARAAARVSHPNVVAVYDAGTVDGRAYLVMELVDGVDLATLLRHGGPLAPTCVAAVTRDLARALEAVHAAGFVHRDVTPGNVLVTRAGTVKLTDLGTARVAGGDGVDRVTRTGIVIGTVDYLAPEQLGPEPASPATDVYAAGLVLRTCATAERPFGGGTVTERTARRLTEDPPPPSGVPTWIVELVAATCRRDEHDRPVDGGALVELVEATVPPEGSDARARLADRVAGAVTAGPGDVDGAAEAERASAATDDGDGRTAVLDLGRTATTAIPAAADATASDGDDDRDTTGPVPVPPPSGRATATGPSTPTHPSDRRQRSLLVLAGLVLAAVVTAVVLTGGGPDGAGDGDSDDGTGGDEATALPISGASAFDPVGGDGENDDEAARAVDGDGSTDWQTTGYDSDDFGGLKDGVGLVVDLGEARDVGAVELVLGIEGVDLEVYVTEEAPTGPPDGALLGRVEDASATTTVEGDPLSGRYVTVWFTQLTGPTGSDGRSRGSVAEVTVVP